MTNQRLDMLQAELEARRAATLERIQNGANTNRIPLASRSFSARSKDAAPERAPPIPAPVPPLPLEKQIEQLQRELAIMAARVDMLEGDDGQGDVLNLYDPEALSSFMWERIDDTNIRIFGGYFNIPERGRYTLGVNVDLNLAGASTYYITMSYNLQTNSGAITAETSVLESTGTMRYRIYYTFKKAADNSYYLFRVNNIGDFNISTSPQGGGITGSIQRWSAASNYWDVLDPPGGANAQGVLAFTIAANTHWTQTILYAGAAVGDIQYWNGSAFVALAAPAYDALLRNNSGTLSWVDRAEYLNP